MNWFFVVFHSTPHECETDQKGSDECKAHARSTPPSDDFPWVENILMSLTLQLFASTDERVMAGCYVRWYGPGGGVERT